MINFMSILKAVVNTVKNSVRSKLTSHFLQPWQYNRPLIYPEDKRSLVQANKSWVFIAQKKNALRISSVKLKLFSAKMSTNSKFIREYKEVSRQHKLFLYNQANLQNYLTKAVDIVEITDHAFIALLKHVNKQISKSELLEGTSAYMDLTGDCYWYIVKDESTGLPKEIWQAPPQFMTIVPDEEEFIKGYIFQRGIEKTAFASEEIIHFKFFNPNSPYYGLAPLAAVADAVDVHRNIIAYEKAIFQNMGQIAGVLTTDQRIPDIKDRKAIMAQWEALMGGVDNSGKIALLELGTSFQQIAVSPRDLGFLKGKPMTENEILNAFGQTESLRKSTSKADALVADRSWNRDAILPRLTIIQDKINQDLMPMFNDETLFVAFDNPVPEDGEELRNERDTNIKLGITTLDEERAKMGLEPYEGGIGAVPYLPFSLAPLGSPSQQGGNGDEKALIDKIAMQMTKQLTS